MGLLNSVVECPPIDSALHSTLDECLKVAFLLFLAHSVRFKVECVQIVTRAAMYLVLPFMVLEVVQI